MAVVRCPRHCRDSASKEAEPYSGYTKAQNQAVILNRNSSADLDIRVRSTNKSNNHNRFMVRPSDATLQFNTHLIRATRSKAYTSRWSQEMWKSSSFYAMGFELETHKLAACGFFMWRRGPSWVFQRSRISLSTWEMKRLFGCNNLIVTVQLVCHNVLPAWDEFHG